MSTFQIYGDYIGDGLNTTAPSFGTDQIKDGNNKALPLVQGRDNILGTNLRYVVINGDSNVVCDDCENIVILNSSGNIVNAGLSNVTLINTYDFHATSGDIYYVNGFDAKIYSGEGNVRHTSVSTELESTDGSLFVTTGANDVTITIDTIFERAVNAGEVRPPIFNIKKIDSGAGRVFIDMLIDDTNGIYLTRRTESITIQWGGIVDGSWYII